MSMTKTYFIGALLTGALISPLLITEVNAKEIEIYRWVDKNNIVHFSQNLPKGDDYTELSTVSSFTALSKAEKDALSKEGDLAKSAKEQEQAQQDIIDKNKATYEKNCKAAKLNVKMLNSLDELHINEELSDGSIGSRPLTLAEKEDKLITSKKHVEMYCSK